MKNGKSPIVRYLIAIAVCSVAAGLILWTHGFDTAETLTERYKILSDAFTIPGVLSIMICALLWSSTLGAFDGIGYTVGQIGTMLLPMYGTKSKHRTYYDYKESKKDKRIKGYSFLLFVGLGFLAVGIVFTILFHT